MFSIKNKSIRFNWSLIAKSKKWGLAILCFEFFFIGFEILVLFQFENSYLLLINGPLTYIAFYLLGNNILSAKLGLHFVLPVIFFTLYHLHLIPQGNHIYNILPFSSLVVYGFWNGYRSKASINSTIKVWLKFKSIFLFLFSMVFVLCQLKKRHIVVTEFDPVFVLAFFLMITALLNALFCWFSVRDPDFVNGVSTICLDYKEPNSLPQFSKDKEIAVIYAFFENSSLYLNPNFSFDDFSNALGQSKKELSLLLNHKLGVNFYTLLAEKRIEVAKKMIDDGGDRYTVDVLMQETGFFSKSAFNRNFKKIIGQTPTEYRNFRKQQTD